MSKQIYIYVTPFFPEPGRHYGSYGYDFVEALKRNSDYDVRVFVAGSGSDYDFEGCHVYRFPIRSLPSALLPFLFARYNIKSFVSAVKRAGIEIANVAVCHGNTAHYSIYPLAIKKLNQECLTILHHHDLDGFGLRLGRFRHIWLHKVINFFIVRRLFEQMDCHVFISEASKNSTLSFPDTTWSVYKDYRRLGYGISFFKSAKIRNPIILWNGVNTSMFNQLGRCSLDKCETFIIGCVGNFIEVKDHMSLIKAIEMLRGEIPGVRLEILGTNGVGSYYLDAKKYVEENEMTGIVRFIENVSHDAMPDFYRRWELMVLPSYFEGFGCVYLEAWACGTPFIACKGQGIEDVLPEEDKEKWLCQPMDVRDVASKIHKYYLHRYEQKVVDDISIDALVKDFVFRISNL